MNQNYKKNDGFAKRKAIAAKLGITWRLYPAWVGGLYAAGMSCQEIADKILKETGETITRRSIQATVGDRKSGVALRDRGDAFRLALTRKRGKLAKWQVGAKGEGTVAGTGTEGGKQA